MCRTLMVGACGFGGPLWALRWLVAHAWVHAVVSLVCAVIMAPAVHMAQAPALFHACRGATSKGDP